ncbi:MAG: hypothetical protein IPN69_04405 [Acidobacteria bacterium]|nr:hypothetical protein [Acidobacteriota bacterium]
MSECEDRQLTIRQVCACYFDRTKWWWWFSLSLKVGAFALGVVAILWPQMGVWVAGVVAVLLFSAEASNICTNHFRSIAESFLRKLDFKNSFGWTISNTEIADAVATLPKRVRNRLANNSKPDDYFASVESEGYRRGMQNLQESSWWSKLLAQSMCKICVSLTVALVSFSIGMLFVSFWLVSSVEPLTAISRVVISILMLVVSLGLIPLSINYNTFANKSEKSQTRATELLKSNSDDNETQCIKALNEYHLARAASPLIPTLLWRMKEGHLNETWKLFVAGQR